MTPENRAREIIDRLLQTAGWTYTVEATAESEEERGFADYIMFDQQGTAMVVLEAKAAGKHPLVGKEQARSYARTLNIRTVILSNGYRHYLWDTLQGNPVPIISIPTPEQLLNPVERPVRDRSGIWSAPAEDVFPVSREPREYQLQAIRAIQDAARQGQTNFLLEMATGTGKTTVAAAVCRLYITTGNADHILFLVDRIELRGQAVQDISEALDHQFKVDEYKGNQDYDWDRTHITVATIHSISRLFNGYDLFAPDQFDLIVTDEAHRCISGPERRAVFEGFQAEKVGLTATPRLLLLSVDDSSDQETTMEARSLRDTYHAFNLEPGEPTFSYTIDQAQLDGFLVGPTAVDVRTNVTTQLMSDEGFIASMSTVDEYESEMDKEVRFHVKNYERSFKSRATNEEFCREFIRESLKEPGTNLIGKGIIYAVTQPHAAQLTNILNELADELWPGVYNSDFAVQVTSDVNRANTYGKAFKANTLNGQDPHNRNYKTSKTRICVTVAMMTTGYDCPDLLNIGLLRLIKSVTDFTQIKGRGTRKYEFRNNITDPLIRAYAPEQPKEGFKIIDFFGVCEYHQENHLYEVTQPRNRRTENEPTANGNSTPPDREDSVYFYRGEDETESVTSLEFDYDANTIVSRREAILREREEANENLRAAWREYLSKYPIDDDTDRKNAQQLFEAYATSSEVREAIDSRRSARLDGTTLESATYRATPEEHRVRIPTYLKSTILAEGQPS